MVSYADEMASIQLIRSATLRIEYGGLNLLVDPMLAGKGELKSILGINRNPIMRLPIPAEEICRNIDWVICTHTHFDHYDSIAACMLKNVPTICQPEDSSYFNKLGIQSVSVQEIVKLSDIEIIRIPGQHGRGKLKEILGPVSGYIIRSNKLPTIYIVGDCILTDDIIRTINHYSPDYIVLNSGGAINPALDSLDGAFLMDEKDVVAVIQQSPPKSKIIAVHMEALDHCQTNRSVLKDEVNAAGILEGKLLIPKDGETIVLQF